MRGNVAIIVVIVVGVIFGIEQFKSLATRKIHSVSPKAAAATAAWPPKDYFT